MFLRCTHELPRGMGLLRFLPWGRSVRPLFFSLCGGASGHNWFRIIRGSSYWLQEPSPCWPFRCPCRSLLVRSHVARLLLSPAGFSDGSSSHFGAVWPLTRRPALVLARRFSRLAWLQAFRFPSTVFFVAITSSQYLVIVSLSLSFPTSALISTAGDRSFPITFFNACRCSWKRGHTCSTCWVKSTSASHSWHSVVSSVPIRHRYSPRLREYLDYPEGEGSRSSVHSSVPCARTAAISLQFPLLLLASCCFPLSRARFLCFRQAVPIPLKRLDLPVCLVVRSRQYAKGHQTRQC